MTVAIDRALNILRQHVRDRTPGALISLADQVAGEHIDPLDLAYTVAGECEDAAVAAGLPLGWLDVGMLAEAACADLEALARGDLAGIDNEDALGALLARCYEVSEVDPDDGGDLDRRPEPEPPEASAWYAGILDLARANLKDRAVLDFIARARPGDVLDLGPHALRVRRIA
jgi:hypothetical protein